VLVSERRGHARGLAAHAVAQEAALVMAWGGDGTMNDVASALVGTSAALGLIRAGSGNGLARSLGVPPNVAHAVKASCGAEPRSIDAGRCNDEWFFNVAGVGFDAYVAAAFDRRHATGRGLLSYMRATAAGLTNYRARRYVIDGVPTSGRTLLVTVANGNQFGNGARIAPDARLDDGWLDLVLVEERSRLASMLAVPRLFTGGVARVPGVSIRRVAQVTIAGESPLEYHLDGEPRAGATRLDVRVVPASFASGAEPRRPLGGA
jgi:YegS/Rv2252/BmrU family lipid kinase